MWTPLKKDLEDSYEQHDPTAKENVSKYIQKCFLHGWAGFPIFSEIRTMHRTPRVQARPVLFPTQRISEFNPFCNLRTKKRPLGFPDIQQLKKMHLFICQYFLCRFHFLVLQCLLSWEIKEFILLEDSPKIALNLLQFIHFISYNTASFFAFE